MTQTRSHEAEAGPFGVADGHRANIDSRAFVRFDAGLTPTGLTTRSDDRTARVVVGKKGAGKTVYLRRFQAASDDEESIYATKVDPQPPDTDTIVRFCQWYKGEDLTERWSMVWRAAILRAVSAHVLYASALSEYGGEGLRECIEDAAEGLIPGVTTPRSVHNQLTELINGHQSSRELEQTLRRPEWGNLEHWLGEFLAEAPPTFFYLDAVDEEYAKAPSYWLRCQQGLFAQVMRLLRDPVLGGRLHVVIAIRENVFASVLRSEHATRYRTDPHVRILAWDRAAIGHFLRSKLSQLTPECAMGGDAGRTTAQWLGRDTVYNTMRGVVEPVEDYLLRHTRLLPRDIVLLGNELSFAVEHAKSAGNASVDEDTIRRVVGDVARWCGDEQLEICAAQIAADLIPRNALRREHVDTYVGSSEYRRALSERIGAVVRGVGCDQFGPDELREIAAGGHACFEDDAIDLPTVLWQNGLLGFRDPRLGEDEWIFHGVEDVDRFHVPVDRSRYAFHPCLLDALGFTGAGLGSQPVKPWRRVRL